MFGGAVVLRWEQKAHRPKPPLLWKGAQEEGAQAEHLPHTIQPAVPALPTRKRRSSQHHPPPAVGFASSVSALLPQPTPMLFSLHGNRHNTGWMALQNHRQLSAVVAAVQLAFLKTRMAIFPAYVPVSHVHEVPMEARRHCWITLDWSYRQLLATTWVFGYKSRSSWKRNQHS